MVLILYFSSLPFFLHENRYLTLDLLSDMDSEHCRLSKSCNFCLQVMSQNIRNISLLCYSSDERKQRNPRNFFFSYLMTLPKTSNNIEMTLTCPFHFLSEFSTFQRRVKEKENGKMNRRYFFFLFPLII